MRSNQSILKEISPGCSLEGLMLNLKLQYFGHLMWRADSFEKTLMLEKIEGRRRRGRQDEIAGWHHWLNGHGFGWTPGVGDGQGGLACCGSWGLKELDMTEQLNWTELKRWCCKSAAFNMPANLENSAVATGLEKVSFCREPEWGPPSVAKVMKKEAWHTQRRDRASGVPLDILEHLPPKTRVCLLYCFVLSTLTLVGAVPHYHLALSDKELTYSSS